MKILVDESGDLGWNFDKPYRAGGSSRYLTVACLIVPKSHYRRPRDIISQLYDKYHWASEKKAADASIDQKLDFCDRAKALLVKHPDIKLDVITVNKANVQAHIRKDPNKLYNYMLGLIIPDYVTKETRFTLVPDERSLKVKSQNSLKDYIQTKLWFDVGCGTTVIYQPGISSQDYTLQFVDWIAHCIWKGYEDGDKSFREVLGPVTNLRNLFF